MLVWINAKRKRKTDLSHSLTSSRYDFPIVLAICTVQNAGICRW